MREEFVYELASGTLYPRVGGDVVKSCAVQFL